MSFKNIFILAISLFMLSTAGVIVKFSTLHPVTLLIWRLSFVVLILMPFYLLKKQKLPTLYEMAEIAFVSIFMVGHFYTWFKGVPLLSVSVASIIYATNPIYTAIISYFVLKEEYHLRYFLSFIMAIIGIVFTVKDDFKAHSLNVEGISLMIATAILYSLYMAFSKKFVLKETILVTVFFSIYFQQYFQY